MTRRPAAEEFPNPLRIIDLDHLARQTSGDRELEREVLALFLEQLRAVTDEIARVSPEDRLAMLHKLKGAARGVGVFDLADSVERIERDPGPGNRRAFRRAAAAAVAAVEARLAAGVSQG